MADVPCTGCAYIQANRNCRLGQGTRATDATCSLSALLRLNNIKQARAIMAGYKAETARLKVTVHDFRLCQGGAHLTLIVQVEGEQQERELVYELRQLYGALRDAPQEQFREAVVEHLRLCDATSAEQAQIALDGQTFYLAMPGIGE